ncbi:MAG TPA: serine/threonine-protein kinase [Spirochaetota bacterium]|mgnify:CR=1 FL=1|nr:serine/threonine-protein kinase [Spirochaetota bacterium]HOM38459.1 serine/threonine-protein kinase [Spirochaetota bacterium]HPQ48999.1 serine/threonine-protein kinase [Spirochaetota bacterium]
MENIGILSQSEIINNRYQIILLIGKGGFGYTYLALDQVDKNEVAIKVVPFSNIKEWKELDLFEREIKVLKNIKHPNIPAYIDDFSFIKNNDQYFVLVQKYIKGKSLKQLIEDGKRFSIQEVENILKSLLEVLVYLHNLQPPIIHRDIKPNNIIIGEDGKPYLVDFGSVGSLVKDTVAASNTFVGTIGYMSQEQLYGKAIPASDIYSLGMTMVYILTGKDPVSFDMDGEKVKYDSYVNIPNRLKLLIDKMIMVDYTRRIGDAKKALDYLNGKSLQVGEERLASKKVKVEVISDSVKMINFKMTANRFLGIFLIFFSIAWDSMVFGVALPSIVAENLNFVFFLLPFIIAGIFLPLFACYNLFGNYSLFLNKDYLKLEKSVLGFVFSSKSLNYIDYKGVKVYKKVSRSNNNYNEYYVVNVSGIKNTIEIGDLMGFDEDDAEFLAQVIDKHIKDNFLT